MIDFTLDRQGRDRGSEKQELEVGKDSNWMSPSESASWAGTGLRGNSQNQVTTGGAVMS